MGKLINLVTPVHMKTKRDYLPKMIDDKAKGMTVARQYGQAFFDGERKYGYGGFRYDGRWEETARQLIELYQLPPNARILDVGCGKGFLLYEFKKLLPECTIKGLDISEYAITYGKEEIRKDLMVGRAQDPYPFQNNEFDLTVSFTTLHNLKVFELKLALAEVERVSKNKFIVVESYRNELELFNLQCWALTCESFFDPDEWCWLYDQFGYTGDYEFIFFE
jgi:SAM-dependent methyltransferase